MKSDRMKTKQDEAKNVCFFDCSSKERKNEGKHFKKLELLLLMKINVDFFKESLFAEAQIFIFKRVSQPQTGKR